MSRPLTAKAESERALSEVLRCIDEKRSFVMEAGAGAGKTHSLVKALEHVLLNSSRRATGPRPFVACITYTNVARDEIKKRIDNDPRVFCDTIHGFAWGLIAQFQSSLKSKLKNNEKWQDREAKHGFIESQPIRYSFGLPRIKNDVILLGHDDVIRLLSEFLREVKFQRFLRSKFKYVFIDEYQDTDSRLMSSLKTNVLSDANEYPVLGLFGDHWQQIYQGVCGKVEHPNLCQIGKGANFRSGREVVRLLNKMRFELPQVPDRSDVRGDVNVFHTNSWTGERLTKGHWAGDLPSDEAKNALHMVRTQLEEDGWFTLSSDSKILMLTHRQLATEQGYESLPEIYPYSDVFRKLEDAHLEFFVERLEPACETYKRGEYGAMFRAMGDKNAVLTSSQQKAELRSRFDALIELRTRGTVRDVVEYLAAGSFPRLSARAERQETRLRAALADGDELSRSLESLLRLKDVPYSEIVAFVKFHRDNALYATKHGVKGAEFGDVLVVVGRGWNLYNFDRMLAVAAVSDSLPEKEMVAYLRNRNLFYVSCSRARNRLAVLFTQALSAESLITLSSWFGEENLVAVEL